MGVQLRAAQAGDSALLAYERIGLSAQRAAIESGLSLPGSEFALGALHRLSTWRAPEGGLI